MTDPLDILDAAANAYAMSVRASAGRMSDDEILESQSRLARTLRLLDTAAAELAAHVAHRSRRELGYDGLAQKRGARTAEALVQQVTGASTATARRLVRVGTLVVEHADVTAVNTEPWLEPLLDALATSLISTEAVDAARTALGAPTESVTAGVLRGAAHDLALVAQTASVDRVLAHARELRSQLDIAAVAARESELRDRRYLRLTPLPDGMTRVSGLLDPESAAIVGAAVDVATSPRRGGPRFVDTARAEWAASLVADDRTTEQVALDALVELVELVDRDGRSDARRLGARRADVRVLVTQADLDRRAGVGYLEGQPQPISLDTVERLACDGGLIPILFDDGGRAMDVGRTQRLHTATQRTAIAARDGGCLMPECDRPPSWCEVHHITEFSRGGVTSVDDGVLLCRHHHMLVHNNHWSIVRDDAGYWLIPPPDVDARQLPIPLPTKSAAVRRMRLTG